MTFTESSNASSRRTLSRFQLNCESLSKTSPTSRYFRRFEITGGLRGTQVKSSATAELGPIALPRFHDRITIDLRRIVGPARYARWPRPLSLDRWASRQGNVRFLPKGAVRDCWRECQLSNRHRTMECEDWEDGSVPFPDAHPCRIAPT